VTAVGRRGKYLLLEMDEGLLLVHLGMSGSLRFMHPKEITPRGPHDHFDLMTASGTLRLHDPRRFGAVVHARSLDDPVACKLLGKLGMEPLSDQFQRDTFFAGLRVSRLSIKQLLLAGRLVVGVGNIYAAEALFLAGIRPTTQASRIGPVRAGRLHAAIRQVLALSVERGGSTLRDFSSPDGNEGHFQESAQVYGRQGAPCHVCATPVKMVRQGQRSSFFCPRCQRA
jgi:formamidopyrimidine-DNA glycosylase